MSVLARAPQPSIIPSHKMGKSPKKTKLANQRPEVPVAEIALLPDGTAATFSQEHVTPISLDATAGDPVAWLDHAASLMRAAQAVWRQVQVDRAEQGTQLRTAGALDPVGRAGLGHQVLFLAALGLEDALKAAAVAGWSGQSSAVTTGQLAPALKTHDLVNLASQAGVGAADPEQEQALHIGQHYVEWLGRYPCPVGHEEYPSHGSVNVPPLLAAYEALFLFCVERVARRLFASAKLGPAQTPEIIVGNWRGLYRRKLGGVDPPPPGAERTSHEMGWATASAKSQDATPATITVRFPAQASPAGGSDDDSNQGRESAVRHGHRAHGGAGPRAGERAKLPAVNEPTKEPPTESTSSASATEPHASRPLARHVLTILAVRDLARSTAFYRTAFGWPLRVEAPVYVELELPDGRGLGVYQREGFAKNTGLLPASVPEGEITGTELYFHVDVVDEAVQRLVDAGARLLSPARPRDWGDVAAYVSDPDGNVIVVARPLSSPPDK
jgi:predicted enzyme related to lactoylglutathione lyase